MSKSKKNSATKSARTSAKSTPVTQPQPDALTEVLADSEPVADMAPSDAVPETLPTGTSAAVSTARRTKGLDRALAMRLCTESGLPHLPKGTTDMFGVARGARVVVPRSSSVTRLYVYKLEAPALVGYHTPERRKELGLGSISHVVEMPTQADLVACIEAVKAHLALQSAPSSEGSSGAPATGATTPAGDDRQNAPVTTGTTAIGTGGSNRTDGGGAS